MRTRPTAQAPVAVPAAPADERNPGDVPLPLLSLDALSLDTLPGAARDRLAGPSVGTAPARAPRFSVDRLRLTRERAEDAVANVRVGRVDPVLHEYVRDARLRFEEGARRIAAELPLGARATTKAWADGYTARVAEANARAAAARNVTRRESDSQDGDAPRPSNEWRPDVLGAYGEARSAAEAGSVERHVTVCLTVAPGRDTTVAVERGSGDQALDQLAREAFTGAAEARPVPADAHTATACYDLRIRAYRIPPLPVLSCGIDKHGPTCAWPLKKVTSVSVHLESVDYPDDGHEHPTLLRRPH